MADLGNDLYTGRRSLDVVGRARTWYLLSAAVMAIALAGLVTKGMTFGLEFTGGSEFRVATADAPDDYETRATDAVREVAGAGASARVSTLGGSTVRVQTEEMSGDQTRAVGESLADAFSVPSEDVSSTLIGPSWGASVSQQALRALLVFLVLTTILMALYFRTWKMAAAAMVALAHDMLITVGIYVLSGFEISPATMIGFLTVLGYSLYDTVVVFDKVREDTDEALRTGRRTFAEAANLAVNQTLVRSINTSVIAVLPILAVLVIGFARLGPGTLLDLSLALFVGMTVGAFSSVFIATPLLVWLRRNDPDVVALDRRAAAWAAGTPEQEDSARDRRARRRITPPAMPAGGSTAVGVSPAAASRRSTAVLDGPTPEPDDTEADDTEPQDAEPQDTEPDDTGARTVTGRKVHKYAQSAAPTAPTRRRPGRGR